MLGQFLPHSIRIRVRFVDLVDGDDDRHSGRARVFDGFDRLRHDAVVSRHNQHDDVGRFGSARAHHRERLVARRVEKHHATFFIRVVRTRHLHAVGADVLGDTASFSGGDVGRANAIEQRSLAVIDVAHDRDDRRAWQFDVVCVGRDQFFKLFFRNHLLKRYERDVIAKALAQIGGDIVVQG